MNAYEDKTKNLMLLEKSKYIYKSVITRASQNYQYFFFYALLYDGRRSYIVINEYLSGDPHLGMFFLRKKVFGWFQSLFTIKFLEEKIAQSIFERTTKMTIVRSKCWTVIRVM